MQNCLFSMFMRVGVSSVGHLHACADLETSMFTSFQVQIQMWSSFYEDILFPLLLCIFLGWYISGVWLEGFYKLCGLTGKEIVDLFPVGRHIFCSFLSSHFQNHIYLFRSFSLSLLRLYFLWLHLLAFLSFLLLLVMCFPIYNTDSEDTTDAMFSPLVLF